MFQARRRRRFFWEVHITPPSKHQKSGEGGVYYFLHTLGESAKRGGGWLPSGATKGG